MIIVAVAVFGVLGLAATSADQSGDKSEGTKVCPIKVSGMFCGECAKTVEKAAKKINAVKEAKVSQPKGSPRSPTIQRRYLVTRSRERSARRLRSGQKLKHQRRSIAPLAKRRPALPLIERYSECIRGC